MTAGVLRICLFPLSLLLAAALLLAGCGDQLTIIEECEIARSQHLRLLAGGPLTAEQVTDVIRWCRDADPEVVAAREARELAAKCELMAAEDAQLAAEDAQRQLDLQEPEGSIARLAAEFEYSPAVKRLIANRKTALKARCEDLRSRDGDL